jgi:Ca-activated chloride channel family protein
MRFADPQFLLLFWLVALTALALVWLERRRKKAMTRFAESVVLDEITRQVNWNGYRWKAMLFIAALALSVVALARPQWGFEWQEVKRKGLDILIALDVSKSMLTQDVKPSRLERTKLALKDFLKKLNGDRIGLVAFSGKAFLACPLTVDYNGFMLSLEDLDVRSVPRGGTNIAEAIREAIKEYDQTPSQYKAVIVLTDGENLEGVPLAAAKAAKEKGIKIYTIGIGTKEGDLIRVPDVFGDNAFLKDGNGNFVKSRLNEKLLQEIALTTGGAYIRAGGAQFGLDLLYDRELSKMEKREFDSKMERRYFDRFQIPLFIVLLLLIGESLWPVWKKA